MSTPTDEKITSPANPAEQMAAMHGLRVALKAAVEANVQQSHGTLVGALRALDLDDRHVVLWCIVPKGAAMQMAQRWPEVTL